MTARTTGTSITLPLLVKLPLAVLPRKPAVLALQGILNTVFAAPLRNGDIDFLNGRLISVQVVDADVEFTITARDSRLYVSRRGPDADLTISGNAYAFLQLATRSADADTLFFRRELSTFGDTELGLYLKNFLDGLDPDSLPLHRLTQTVLRLAVAISELNPYFTTRST